MPYLPMVKAIAPKAPMGATFMMMLTTPKIASEVHLDDVEDRLALLAHEGEAEAEQHRENST